MPAIDTYATTFSGMDCPSVHAEVIGAGSDAGPLAVVTRGLYVGSAGNVSVVMLDGSTAVFQNVGSGTVLPIRVSKVNATGTTANGIIGLS